MSYPTAPIKTHYAPVQGHGFAGTRILWCSGRAVSYVYTSSKVEDVTCGSCLRKLAKIVR